MTTTAHIVDSDWGTAAKTKGATTVVDRLVLQLIGSPAKKPVEASYLHPLDPLTPDEVVLAAKVCRETAERKGQAPLRFNAITLQEPPKADLVRYNAGALKQLPRVAFCVLQLPKCDTVVEAHVVLSEQRPSVAAWKEVKNVQPMCSIDDALEAEELVLNDPIIAQLVRERYGVTDVKKQLVADPWYCGSRTRGGIGRSAEETQVGRFMYCYMYLRNGLNDNHYAHPLDLIIHLDMAAKKILHDKCFMHKEVPKIPMLNSNFDAERSAAERGVRTGLKPWNVVQPQGPSFTVDGNHVNWQKWDFRVSFNYREGLVLHDIKYEDQGRMRPIMHRMSLTEIIVPYGDPRHPFETKCAYDVVDYGLGNCCSSLELGCDCLGVIKYFDAVLSDKHGEPLIVKKAVCMHEEDTGIAWKHVEYRNERNEARRSRRLSLSFVATIANYEYVTFIYLQTDGTIHFEIKLTGCLSTSIMSEGEGDLPTNGTLLSPGLNGQIHQHFFCVRMDPAIDDTNGGANLTVSEINVQSMPEGPENPYGVGFFHAETELETELQAIRCVDPAKSRIWKIKNPNVKNPLSGASVAYKLVPHASPPMYALPNSSHAIGGAWATKQLWVTPYSDTEKYPAGMHPYEKDGCIGLPDWTQADRQVANSDVVVWHSFGVTHLPRTEDWPVMPVETVGFHLKPANFFDVNPALDIPAGPQGTNKEVSCPHAGAQQSSKSRI